MKKYLFLFAALLAIVACEQKIEILPANNQSETVLVFKSDKPQFENTTRTAWDETSNGIVWTAGDRIRVGYTLEGAWMGAEGPADFSVTPKVPAKFFVSNNVSINADDASIGTFTVPTSYSNSPSGSAVFYSIYPSSCTSTDSNYAPSLTVDIPNIQTPEINSFDPAADIMVGKTAATALSGAMPTDPIALNWDRVVAHADITFKNLQVDGDASVNKITLVFNSEAKVVGRVYLDVTNGAVTTTDNSSNQIDILGNNLSINEGSIEAWAAVLPVTFTSVDVTVKTDLATYTRSITGISKTFKQNARNTLAINMSGASRTLNSIIIPDGNYIIAAESMETFYAISSLQNGSSNPRRDRVELPEGFNPSNYSASTPYSADNSIIWTITNVTGGVTINLAGDTNSYMQYGNNTLPLGNSGAVFEVEEGDGTYTFANNGRYISMNNTNGFGCYSSTVPGIVKDIYVIPAAGTPSLIFSETSKTVAADVESVSFTYTSRFLASDPSVAITSDSGNAVSSTSIANGALIVNLNANTTSNPKSVTLTVSAPGVNDVVITINQAGVVPDAENGDVLWAESFTGFSNNDVPTSSNNSTVVYGNRSLTYVCVNGASDTKIYSAALAGGTTPELLISKNGGSFTVSGIPTGNATQMTLTFKSNKGCVVSCPVEGSVVSALDSYAYIISIPTATSTFILTFENSTGDNTRVDDFVLVAGAPEPGITVTTNAATSIASNSGTTATLNGELALLNGATNSNVTEAGFYYKLTSANDYTKVTCASAPTSTTSFSYDLTSLTKDSEYTFYAYAIYDSGSEVAGDPMTFTPTQGGGTKHVATIYFGNGTGDTNVNAASVNGNDSEGNTWTVTTEGTTSFTPNGNYAQIGSSNKPATSITFTTTLASSATDIVIRAKFGGFSGTAGTVTLKVGDTSIGTGSLNASTDVTVSSSTTGTGTVLTVTVTNIRKGVKAYWIEATYTN